MKMKRYLELEQSGGKLTSEEKQEGWHYCPDYDFLLKRICDEEPCTCGFEHHVKKPLDKP